MSLARNATASQSSTQTNGYERHQPEQTLLYQLVEQHYPAFKASLEAQGQHLPRYIQQEFDVLIARTIAVIKAHYNRNKRELSLIHI